MLVVDVLVVDLLVVDVLVVDVLVVGAPVTPPLRASRTGRRTNPNMVLDNDVGMTNNSGKQVQIRRDIRSGGGGTAILALENGAGAWLDALFIHNLGRS